MGLFGKKGIFKKIFKVAAPALFGPAGGVAAGLMGAMGGKKKKKKRGGFMQPPQREQFTYGPAPTAQFGQPMMAPQMIAPYPPPRYGPGYSPEAPAPAPPWASTPLTGPVPQAEAPLPPQVGGLPPLNEPSPVGLPPIDEQEYNKVMAGVTDVAEDADDP